MSASVHGLPVGGVSAGRRRPNPELDMARRRARVGPPTRCPRSVVRYEADGVGQFGRSEQVGLERVAHASPSSAPPFAHSAEPALAGNRGGPPELVAGPLYHSPHLRRLPYVIGQPEHETAVRGPLAPRTAPGLRRGGEPLPEAVAVETLGDGAPGCP